MSDDTDAVLRTWRDALLAELATEDRGLSTVEVDIDGVLGLAGSVAHGVIRPAAPLTAYLVGLAVGRATASGADPAAAFDTVSTRARALAATGSFAPPAP